jgi:hypothetical protein
MPKEASRAALISATVLSAVMSSEGDRVRTMEGLSIIYCEPGLCDQFNGAFTHR